MIYHSKNIRKKIYLLLILLIALLLRFWNLDSYPPLNADEAAIGYNAYSLIETGKDEHGDPWPIHFQSFNDYKPGLYFYMALPLVKFFGLNEWAVRIPGAFLGVATVYLVYLLVSELFAKQKTQLLAIITAFMLAISPWHIHFSRGGWEVNVATFFIVLGAWLFVKANKEVFSIKYLVLSMLSFVASLYTYHASRIVIPFLGFGLLFIYKEAVKENFKSLLLAGLIGLLVVLPLVGDLIKSEVASRVAGVGLFADQGPLARINEQRGEHTDFSGFPAKILHNKLVNYGLAFLQNWSEHFHGEFLFLSGDEVQRNKVPETGQMYMFDLLWIMVGVWWMVKNLNKGPKLVIWWLVVAPTAAALTFQSPHALRAQNMVVPLTIISALGLTQMIEWTKVRIKGRVLLTTYYLLLTTLIIWQFARYEHLYWTHMDKEYPFSSQYGVKELVSYVKENEGKYEKIIVTDRYDQPYILFLFYLKYPPQEFQKNHELTDKDKFGFSTVRNFDKYEFRPITWDKDQPNNPNSLIVGTDEEVPKEANIVKKIHGQNGYLYFEVVAN